MLVFKQLFTFFQAHFSIVKNPIEHAIGEKKRVLRLQVLNHPMGTHLIGKTSINHLAPFSSIFSVQQWMDDLATVWPPLVLFHQFGLF
jgi:hypothetical protein